MKKNLKVIYIFLLVIILLPTIVNAEKENTIEIERISGLSRVETSIEVSRKTYNESKTVILVGYTGEVDALTGLVLAGIKEAPVIFVDQKNLSIIKDLLLSLNVEQVYILGGERVFSDELNNEFNDYNPIRISGEDRYETAIMIAKEVVNEDEDVDEIFLALGDDNFADALAIGPVAARNEKPLLLTSKDNISNSTLDSIKTMKVRKVNIIGGTSAISNRVEDELKNIGIETNRTFGANRELTAITISQRFNPELQNIILTNGWKYADAVIGGYFAAKNDASILLTQDNNINLDTLNYIKYNEKKVYILGGENSINEVVKRDIEYIADGYEIKEEQNNLNIPFKTINSDDHTLDKGITKIKNEGTDGVKMVTDRVIFKNQQEVERRNIGNKIIKAPIDKIVLIGTKEKDEINKIKKEYLYFITQNLGLKEKPSSGSKLLITIPKGTHLDCLSTEGSWYKVKYNNRTGYVPTKSIKKGIGYKVDNTIVVNKGYSLSSNFNPGVNPEALNAVNKMKKDAKKAGIKLNVFSDFRTYQYQVNLYDRYVKRDGKKKADAYSARPGHSEHQTGLTFDIGGANPKYYTSQKFGRMKEGIWMAKNSYKYGLILRYPKDKEKITGYSYEPWHFRYVGIDLAKKVKASGLSLDEYLKVVSPNYSN